jgi:hypothetical protein
MPTIRIIIDESELATISAALGREVRPVSVQRKAPTASLAAPVIDTGDAALDAWMHRQYEHGVRPYVAKPAPKPAPLKPRKWTDRDHWLLTQFNEAAVMFWRARGHEVIITGGSIDDNGANVRVLPRAT